MGKKPRNQHPPRAYILANQLHKMFKGVSAIESNKTQERGWNCRGMLAVRACVCVFWGGGQMPPQGDSRAWI